MLWGRGPPPRSCNTCQSNVFPSPTTADPHSRPAALPLSHSHSDVTQPSLTAATLTGCIGYKSSSSHGCSIPCGPTQGIGKAFSNPPLTIKSHLRDPQEWEGSLGIWHFRVSFVRHCATSVSSNMLDKTKDTCETLTLRLTWQKQGDQLLFKNVFLLIHSVSDETKH